jgi:hypothetical protein
VPRNHRDQRGYPEHDGKLRFAERRAASVPTTNPLWVSHTSSTDSVIARRTYRRLSRCARDWAEKSCS